MTDLAACIIGQGGKQRANTDPAFQLFQLPGTALAVGRAAAGHQHYCESRLPSGKWGKEGVHQKRRKPKMTNRRTGFKPTNF